MHPDNANYDSSIEKPSNKNYEADIKHTMRYTRWLLQFLGIWPIISEDSSKVAKHVSKILIPFWFLVSNFILIPALHYAFVREKDVVAKLEILPPVLYLVSGFLKFVVMVYRCDAIKHCVEYMKTDWMRIENEKDRTVMMRNVRAGHRLTFICCGFLYFGGVSFHLAPLWTSKTFNELNQTVRVQAYSGYDTFVDPYKSPNYEIIFVTIFISGFVGCTANFTIYSMSAVFVSHACGQIDIIISRIESFIDESNESLNNDTLRNRICFAIQYHVRILRLSATIETVLQEAYLIEVGTSSVVICLMEYVILLEWNNSDFIVILTYIVGLMSVAFNIFIICYVGELLTEKVMESLMYIFMNSNHERRIDTWIYFSTIYESAQIGASTYMIDWYKLSGRAGLSLIMIMDITNYPVKLTAGKMMQLSISSFGTIMKRSFAYLSMLRTITVQ